MDLVALEWSHTGRYRPDCSHTVGIRRTPCSVRRATAAHQESAADLLARDHGSGLAFAGVPLGDRKAPVLFQRTVGVTLVCSVWPAGKKLRLIP